MNAREAEVLLGGYAAGILTEQEQASLFALALENQALFDALADEEALRALLADPRARAELLRAVTPATDDPRLEPKPQVEYAMRSAMMSAPAGMDEGRFQPAPARKAPGFWSRLFRPAPMAGLAAVSLAVFGLVVVLRPGRERPVQTADSRATQALPPPAAAPETVLPVGPAARADSAPAAGRAAQAPVDPAARVAQAPARLRKESPPVASQENAVRDVERRQAESDRAAAAPPPVRAEPPPPQPAPIPSPPPAVTPAPQVASEAPPVVAVASAPATTLPASAAPPPAGAPRKPAAEGQLAEAKKSERPSGFGGLAGGLSGLRRGNAQGIMRFPPQLTVKTELDGHTTPDTVFPKGSQVRLLVSTPADGTLTVFIDGERRLRMEATARREYPVPVRGFFESEPGKREIRMIFQAPQRSQIETVVRLEFR